MIEVLDFLAQQLHFNAGREREYMPEINAPDLTKRAPRSPGCAWVVMRFFRECSIRAGQRSREKKVSFTTILSLDERVMEFVGIDPEAMKKQLAAGKSDSEILG